ncbi:MAG: RNA-binding domain-containing protein [archaeon]
MKYAHNIEIRVFCKEDEDENAIISVLHKLINFDFEKEKIIIEKKMAETFEDRKLDIITVFTKKQSHTTKFIEDLFFNLSLEQKEMLKRQLNTRLDEKLHFYLRLDKPKLLNGEYLITDGGDCFHIKICIAAYPHKYEVAREIVLKMLVI